PSGVRSARKPCTSPSTCRTATGSANAAPGWSNAAARIPHVIARLMMFITPLAHQRSCRNARRSRMTWTTSSAHNGVSSRSMEYDVIVLGVGGMGSAAVYHAARRGARVLGLERYDIPHDLGSSHGVNRIIRLAYAEHPDYVPLLRRAYQLWRDIERIAGEPVLIVTGGLDAGPDASATGPGSLRSCAVHDLPHELLDASSIAARFPGCRFPPEMVAVYQ